MTNRKCLFGGTILAAGLAGGAAEAQIINHFTFGFAFAVTEGGNNGNSYFGGSFNYAHASPYSFAQAYGGSTWIHAVGSTIGTPGSARGHGLMHYVYFEVAQDTYATAKWDWSGDTISPSPGGGSYSLLWLYDATNATDLVKEFWQNSGSPTGKQVVFLKQGNLYRISIFAMAKGFVGAHSEGMLSIPSPAVAAGLLALSGITAARRRRVDAREH
jgi:hypothetical protein